MFSSLRNVSNIKFGILRRWWDKLTTNQPDSLKCIADLRLLLIYTISRGDYENEWNALPNFLNYFPTTFERAFCERKKALR